MKQYQIAIFGIILILILLAPRVHAKLESPCPQFKTQYQCQRQNPVTGQLGKKFKLVVDKWDPHATEPNLILSGSGFHINATIDGVTHETRNYDREFYIGNCSSGLWKTQLVLTQLFNSYFPGSGAVRIFKETTLSIPRISGLNPKESLQIHIETGIMADNGADLGSEEGL